MDWLTVIDWVVFAGGLVGFVGTLRGWHMFMDERRMFTLIDRFGERAVRWTVAIVYLVLGLIGGVRVLG